MKQPAPSLRRAARLLLAAAALPLAPLAAQETQPPADPPATTTAEPAPQPAPQPQAEAPAPAPTTPVTVEVQSPAPAAATAPAVVRRSAPVRRTARVPAVAAAPAPAPAAVVIQTPPTVTTVPPAAAVVTTPVAPVTTAPVEILPTTPSTGTDVVTVDDTQQQSRTPVWPWVLLGLLLVGGLALLFARRRRGAAIVRDEVYETREPAPAPLVAPEPVIAAAPAGRPRLDLALKPRRAGVAGDGARVEFELTVDNRGTAPAEDVRISTWMLAAPSSEAERTLIEPRDHADVPPVTIAAGQARTMEAAVALPTSEVAGDAILPIVVADAHYRLPDGREEHTRVSYAVGVPDGEELMHFDTENPSGLHEGVVAHALAEPKRA